MAILTPFTKKSGLLTKYSSTTSNILALITIHVYLSSEKYKQNLKFEPGTSGLGDME